MIRTKNLMLGDPFDKVDTTSNDLLLNEVRKTDSAGPFAATDGPAKVLPSAKLKVKV